MASDLPLVILAAGRARRYGGLKQLAPVGMHDEAVIDVVAADAFAAGFTRMILVVNGDTGGAIKEHVEAEWPSEWRVSFCVQEEALGTVSAVLAAREELGDGPFGVCNADDLYGKDAFLQLARELRSGSCHCLVGYSLAHCVVGGLPVSRGICEVDGGVLRSIVERHHVQASDSVFYVDDGLQPSWLPASAVASMNLWGFWPRVIHQMESAFASHDFSAAKELALSTFVNGLLTDGEEFRVATTDSYCLGVTHPDDLALVRKRVAEEVQAGGRPARVFTQRKS